MQMDMRPCAEADSPFSRGTSTGRPEGCFGYARRCCLQHVSSRVREELLLRKSGQDPALRPGPLPHESISLMKCSASVEQGETEAPSLQGEAIRTTPIRRLRRQSADGATAD